MHKYNLKISKIQGMQSGITLVALVITVVVMLILAGVAIAAVVDGDGLFSKTREAVETYENAADKESEMLTNQHMEQEHINLYQSKEQLCGIAYNGEMKIMMQLLEMEL